MKISLVGPGLIPIPPPAWGATETVIWGIGQSLESLGHNVQTINTQNKTEIFQSINEFRPDFVHVHFDYFIDIYPYIEYPKAFTSHSPYTIRPENHHMYGYQRVIRDIVSINPNIICLSDEIKKFYREHIGLPDHILYVVPNGVNTKLFRKTYDPMLADKSLYLAKIEPRKRQHLFQSIEDLYFAGPLDDPNFDKSKNYLGEISKYSLYNDLTDYGNLVLLSDGEAHPLVCMEALSAGLGLVISEYCTANLDTSLEFIDVVKEDKINDIGYVKNVINKNREYSINNRKEILKYSKIFDWSNIIKKNYLPTVERIVSL